MREFETPVIEVKTIDVADEITSSVETVSPTEGPDSLPIN